MPAVSAPPTKVAKMEPEGHFGKNRRRLRTNTVIMLHAHGLWPVGTAAEVAAVTGYSTRAVEDWDANRARIPGDALALLLQSDWGRGFLSALMEQAQPRWWTKLKAFFSAIDGIALQRITRRKFKEALDADYASQIPHAALFQDEEFYIAQPAPPLRPDRAVVRRKTR